MPRPRFPSPSVGMYLLRLGIARAIRQRRTRREVAAHTAQLRVAGFKAAVQALNASMVDTTTQMERLGKALSRLPKGRK